MRRDVRIWVEHLPQARDVTVTVEELAVALADGRRLAVPLRWFPWLVSGSYDQRQNWQLVGDGIGIYWPDFDQDVFVLDLCIPPDPPAEDAV